MKSLAFFFLVTVFSLLTTCSEGEDDDQLIIVCGSPIEITENGLQPGGDDYMVVSVTRTEFCLSVEIEATGCSTEAWTASLRTDGVIAESLPTQSAAYLEFDDAVADDEFTCQAQQRRTFDFDLANYLTGALPTEFQLVGTDQIIVLE